MENIDASKLSKALLQRYTEQIKPPAVSGGSIFYGLACKLYHYNVFKIIIKFYWYFLANLWSILTLNSNVPVQTNQSPLSSLSISVLLILINHCTSPPPPKGNPYRASIAALSGNIIFQNY